MLSAINNIIYMKTKQGNKQFSWTKFQCGLILYSDWCRFHGVFSMQVSCWFCWFRLLVCNLHEGEERVTALKKPSIVFCWFTVSTTWGSQQDSGQGYEGVHHQTSWKGVLSKVPNEKNLHSMSLITSICYRSIDLHSMEGLLALLFWLTHSKFHRSIFPFLRDNIDSQPLWRKTSGDPRPVLANLVAAVLRVKVGKKLGKSGGNWVPMKNRCCCTIHVWIQFGGPKNSHLFPVAWKNTDSQFSVHRQACQNTLNRRTIRFTQGHFLRPVWTWHGMRWPYCNMSTFLTSCKSLPILLGNSRALYIQHWRFSCRV